VCFATIKLAVQPFLAAFHEADLHAGMTGQIARQEWRKSAFDDLWRSTDAERPNLSALERTGPLANSINVSQQPASALKQVREHVKAANDAALEQALKRIELQVVPAASAPVVEVSAPRPVSGAAGGQVDTGTADPADPILANPEEAYRIEVRQAVVDAMLDHSAALGIGADEWLTIGARRNDMRPRIGLDSTAQTFIIRVRGNDLNAFRSGQLSREDAVKRVEVRVF
jgi:hypothetical protein